MKDCRFCGAPVPGINTGQRVHGSDACRFMELTVPFVDNPGCWEWPLSHNVQTGYGQFMRCIDGKRSPTTSHRFSYETFVGQIPAGMHVCHSCDNRPCFNPTHLFVGTNQDNMTDMVSKGRYKPRPRKTGADHHWAKMPERIPRGQAHARATIDERTAKAIKDAPGSKVSIARAFGVSYGIVCSIKYGTAWAHV